MPREACCNIGRGEEERRERRPEAKKTRREDTQEQGERQGERPGMSRLGSGANTSELLLKNWDKYNGILRFFHCTVLYYFETEYTGGIKVNLSTFI